MENKKYVSGGRDTSVSPDAGMVHKEYLNTTIGDLNAEEQTAKLIRTKSYEKINSWVNEINFDSLGDIYKEYAVKANTDPTKLNTPPRADIHLALTDKPGFMQYDPISNQITVDISEPTNFLGGMNMLPEDKERHIRSAIIRGIFHEYTHATGRVQCYITAPREVFEAQVQLGIEISRAVETINPENQKEILYRRGLWVLNEAITERIADEVYMEYARRNDSKEWQLSTSIQPVIDAYMERGGMYGAARRLLIAITTAIANVSTMPEEIIWRGFVHHYYRGDFHGEQESMKKLLNETFGDGFYQELESLQSESDIKEFIEKFPPIQMSIDEAGQKWVTHLELSRGAI